MTLKRPEEFDHFTAALPDLDVHYVRQGSGPILMLWHGWPGSGGTGASLWASMCRTSGGTGQLTQTVRCGIWRFDVKGARLRRARRPGLLAAGDTSGRRPARAARPTWKGAPRQSANPHASSRASGEHPWQGPAPLRTSLRPPLHASRALLRRVTP